MSDVPEGYKMSEVGVIPEEWGAVKFGDNLNIISGMGFNKSEYVDYGIKLLRIDNVSYGEITWESIAFLPMNYMNKYPNLIINSNDILLALNRPITNGKLKIAIVEPKDIPCILYQRVGKIIFLSNLYNKKFTYYLLSKFIKKFVEESSVGSDQPFISTTKLKQIEFPLPPLPEQQAIASALSDVDALIAALEQLITKKRNIKQGAMQRLLTGEKRLPGFGGAWEVKKLGEIAEIKTGKKNNEDKMEEGLYPFFVRSQQVKRINSYSFDGEAILIPGEGNIGSIYHYINGKFDYHQRVYKISNFAEQYSGKFIYLSMSQNFNAHAMKNSVKATVDSLRLPTFQEFELSFPPTKPEQTAIATILSDMDAEIESLEQKQAKYKAIKQGVMQELLTGKTRLV